MRENSVSRAVESIITETLRAAEPGALVSQALAGMADPGPCRTVAVGKAAGAMARAACVALGSGCGPLIGVGPTGALGGGPWPPGSEWFEADHPEPTARNVRAAERVRAFAGETEPGETLLVLLSGGASAMLCLPRAPLTLEDVAAVTGALLRAGAPIGELNAVRKHCEVLKGGGLALASGGTRVVSLVLSDVLGDRLDVIGSGPTAPDPTTFAEALGVLERRGAREVSPAVTSLLERGAAGHEAETVKPGDALWRRVENRVIGNNSLAVEAAARACVAAGFPVMDRPLGVDGEAADVGRRLARAVRLSRGSRGAIVWGGETTVTVGDAPGRGGRNQELALAAAIDLTGDAGVTVLSFGTDGRDGPTDAAGGVVDGMTAAAMRAAGVSGVDALTAHDSYRALDAAGALLRTGPTGTNVNDVMVALIEY